MPTPDPLAGKRADLLEAMMRRLGDRNPEALRHDIASLPEPVLDNLLSYYSAPIHVG